MAMKIIVENVSFESEGHALIGRVYRPDSPGRYPAVALCHGFPGDERNTDLAEEMAFKGMVFLIFYYRGAWESEGEYSFRWLEVSARDALRHLKGLPYVDPDRVGVIGYSLGTLPAVVTMGEGLVKAGAFMSPFADYGMLAPDEVVDYAASVNFEAGRGKLNAPSVESYRDDIVWVREERNILTLIKGVEVPVLFVVGSADKLLPPEHSEALYEAANEPKKRVVIEAANHLYSDHRIPLIQTVMAWFMEHL
jgi:dienelactone hydrolase